MTKTELKAYVSVLKGLAKNRQSPRKGQIMVHLWTATAFPTDKVFAEFNSGIEGLQGEGTYDIKMLDAFLISPTSDLECYRTDDLATFNKEVEWQSVEPLNAETCEKILTASNFTSADDMRVALQQVVIDQGWIMATDGYKAYMEACPTKGVRFSPILMEAFKRLHKYGNWNYSIGVKDNGSKVVCLSNGFFSLTEIQDDHEYPNLKEVMKLSGDYNLIIKLPVANLLKLTTPRETRAKIMRDGSIQLGHHEFSPVPLKAEITSAKPHTPTDDFERREIIMPLMERDCLVGVDLFNLKNLVDKSGEIELLCIEDRLAPLVVIR